MTGTGTI